MEFKPGAATVAARSGIEILPIAIDCNPSFLRKEQPWHYVPPTKPIISIRILPPVSASELVPGHGSERQARHELNVALQDLISHELAALSAPKIAGASAQRT
jgi:1-acyl-sn-glycerol-3-phosphate acyltransferase